MLRFRAVDEGTDSAYDISFENEEAKCLELYKEALALQSSDLRAAKLRYKQLLRSPFLSTTTPSGNAAAPSKLRYLCLKNLADVNEAQGNTNAALKYYAQALTIDSTDAAVWHRVGCLARRAHNQALARHAFEGALVRNPRHWLSLEALLEILFRIGDHSGCMQLCKQLLQMDPGHAPALGIVQQLSGFERGEHQSALPTGCKRPNPYCSVEEEEEENEDMTASITAGPYKIHTLTWEALIKQLLSTFKALSLKGSLSAPVIIELADAIQPPRSSDNESGHPESLSVGEGLKNPLRKRSRFSSEMLVERRQSTRVKDKSVPNDSLFASLTSFFQKWGSPAQPNSSEDAQGSKEIGGESDEILSSTEPEKHKKTQNSEFSNQDEEKTVQEFIVRCASVNSHNGGIVELMRTCLVWACLDHTHSVPWNTQIKERLVALHQAVAAHSTIPHISWIPAAELALELARGDPSIDSSRFLTICLTTIDQLLADHSFIDFLSTTLVIRLFWLCANASAIRGDTMSTHTHLEGCRARLAKGLPAGNKQQISIPYLKEGGLIDEEAVSALEKSLTSEMDETHITNAFKAGNHPEVIRILDELLMGTKSKHSNMRHQERRNFLGLLAESHLACDDTQRALLCGQQLLSETVNNAPNAITDLRQAVSILLKCVHTTHGAALGSLRLIRLLQTTGLTAANHRSR